MQKRRPVYALTNQRHFAKDGAWAWHINDQLLGI